MKLTAREQLEEMQWKYAGGPLPGHRQRARQRAACAGCVGRFLVALLFAALVLLLARLILF